MRYFEINKERVFQGYAEILLKTSSTFHTMIKAINECEEKRLSLDNPENVLLLENKGYSVNKLREEAEECLGDDATFYSRRKFEEYIEDLLFGYEFRYAFSNHIGFTDYVREIVKGFWEPALVPFVLEMLNVISGFANASDLSNLFSLYVVDSAVLNQKQELQLTKKALLQIALEYSGVSADISCPSDGRTYSEVERIALLSRGRKEKEEYMLAEFERYLFDKGVEFIGSSYESQLEDESEYVQEDTLFDLYYEKVIEPIYFDVRSYGSKFLGNRWTETDIDRVIERMELPSELNKDVVRFLLMDARKCIIEDDIDSYNPMWLWGSEHYMDIVERLINKMIKARQRDNELKEKIIHLKKEISAGVDINNLESLLTFGAKFVLLIEYYSFNEKISWGRGYLIRKKIEPDKVIKKYCNYADVLREAYELECIPRCMAWWELKIDEWNALFRDFSDFEEHGAKTEKRLRAFLNRAKHCYHITMSLV